MDNSAFQKIREIEFAENSSRPPGAIRPRMFRQSMIKDRDNNIYAVYGDRLKKGTPFIESHPFLITASDGFLTVAPGTLNNLLPTNLFEGNALTRFSYGKDTIVHVILTGLSNGKQFTSCELVVQVQPPPAQPPTLFGLPEEVQILLGVVYNGAVFQVVKTRLELVGKQLFLKDREEPAEPGQLPYEAYFVWA